jgi:hypothetical protein
MNWRGSVLESGARGHERTNGLHAGDDGPDAVKRLLGGEEDDADVEVPLDLGVQTGRPGLGDRGDPA